MYQLLRAVVGHRRHAAPKRLEDPAARAADRAAGRRRRDTRRRTSTSGSRRRSSRRPRAASATSPASSRCAPRRGTRRARSPPAGRRLVARPARRAASIVFGLLPSACFTPRLSSVARRSPSRNWQARRDSNPQPPVLETGALPIELLAYISLRSGSCSAVAIHRSSLPTTSFPCAPCASGRSGRTCSTPAARSSSSCSSSCCSCGACTRCTPADDVSHGCSCRARLGLGSTGPEPAALSLTLLDDLRDRAGADRAAAFTNREPRALLERDRRDAARR